jgi:hypothetical protein
MGHPRVVAMFAASSEETNMGMKQDLSKLMARPVAEAKSSKTRLRVAAAAGVALQSNYNYKLNDHTDLF